MHDLADTKKLQSLCFQAIKRNDFNSFDTVFNLITERNSEYSLLFAHKLLNLLQTDTSQFYFLAETIEEVDDNIKFVFEVERALNEGNRRKIEKLREHKVFGAYVHDVTGARVIRNGEKSVVVDDEEVIKDCVFVINNFNRI